MMTLDDLLTPGAMPPPQGRQVTYIQEGTLLDPRQNPPLGKMVDLRYPPYGISGLTVFITPRGGAGRDQAYFIHSDTIPVPEPGTLVLASLGGLTLLLGRVTGARVFRRRPAVRS
jgi:hypothetical protein